MEHGLVFILDDRQFALPLAMVSRVVRAVEITRLPQASPMFPGVIDVHGEVMPVVDLRERFELAARALMPSAQFILVDTARRRIALWVDRVGSVAAWEAGDFVTAATLAPGSRHLAAVARGADGLILVHDLDELLASDGTVLEDAVSQEEGRG